MLLACSSFSSSAWLAATPSLVPVSFFLLFSFHFLPVVVSFLSFYFLLYSACAGQAALSGMPPPAESGVERFFFAGF